MTWAKPNENSKSRLDLAGSVLASKKSPNIKKEEAIEILNNWRASHSYPMHVFKMRLKRVSQKIDLQSLAVQRLKRVPSILSKLQRKYSGKKPTMKLSQMQDIAGCRVVMPNVILAKELYQKYYSNGDLKHSKVNEKDYITYPKKDGYRCIHLIYRYGSDKGKTDYNGLLVEIQIRSQLQHVWATAVETVDFFTKQAIKSNKGEKEWTDFFRLVSSAFAKMENCTTVPNTPADEKELYSQIKKIEKELQVRMKMKTWAESIKFFDETRNKPNVDFFLLELDTLQGRLLITSYPKKMEKKAIFDYSEAEKRNQGKKEYDVVLVGADTSSDLKKAYPNYFVDTKEFLKYLQKILDKY